MEEGWEEEADWGAGDRTREGHELVALVAQAQAGQHSQCHEQDASQILGGLSLPGLRPPFEKTFL
jgi:hypothetical protein